MQQFALDTQSFEKLRSRQCLYVDKTEVICRMITDGRTYSLSRHRRFGKTNRTRISHSTPEEMKNSLALHLNGNLYAAKSF
jgi:hypothetical protein